MPDLYNMNDNKHMHPRKYLGLLLLVLVFLPSMIKAQFYNGSQVEFGRAKVQYNDFRWTYYRFNRYDVYFYLNGKELALYAAKFAESEIPEMESQLDGFVEDKLQFIIFNNLNDLKQSNLGTLNNQSYNIGGLTYIIGSKVFVYFDGSLINFEKQLRAGIAEVVINSILMGRSMISQAKNNLLLNVPEWYRQGLISYMSDSWNTDLDNRMRNEIKQGKFKKFNQLQDDDARIAGHSLWHYVADKYGKETIPKILALTKSSRNVEDGFEYGIGISYNTLISEWRQYYQKNFETPDNDLPDSPTALKKSKPETIYYSPSINNDGNYLAYVSNTLGKSKVWIFNTATGKRKVILKRGKKLREKNDYTYPILSWHPNSKELAILNEEKGDVQLRILNVETRDVFKQTLYDYEKICGVSFSPNGRNLIFSAVKKGQSDLFLYDIPSNSSIQLTNDISDDLYPSFFENGKKILFSSNRTTDSIYSGKKFTVGVPQYLDIYALNLKGKESFLQRVTSTPLANEIYGQEYKGKYFTYLSDQSGIYNQYAGFFDSTIAYIDTTTHYRYFSNVFPITDYPVSILQHHVNPKSEQNVQLTYSGKKYQILLNEMFMPNELIPENPETTYFMNTLLNPKKGLDVQNGAINIAIPGKDSTEQMPPTIVQAIKESEGEKGKRFRNLRMSELLTVPADTISSDSLLQKNISIQSTQGTIQVTESEFSMMKPQKTIDEIFKTKQRNYNVEYSVNQLVSQLDYSYLNTFYQPFTGGVVYQTPGMNALIQVGITDLMEDYRFTGGFRLSLNLINNEYLLSFANLKKRLDKEVIFHRQTHEQGYASLFGTLVTRRHSNEFFYTLRWPFNNLLSLKATATYRYEEYVMLATDPLTLEVPNVYENWGGVKLELIYDGTRPLGMNLYEGTRYKIFSEYNQLLDEAGRNLYVFGFDFRNYFKIHRSFIWANRFAGSSSFGTDKLIYYLGGEDNWLFPEFTQDTPIDYTQNYSYQTLATNLRGFDQNIRNGENFLVFNTELRFPVFRYLMNRPIRSEFINNFQVVAFGDVGTAWSGVNPYSDDNVLYTKYIYSGPLRVKVQYQVEPIVGGIGFGLRSTVLGYFLRADWGWGLKDGEFRDAVFYLSLSLDF